MPPLRDEAIVLRTHKLGEADRIITMLTRTPGVRAGRRQWVRRTKSRFGSRLEPGMVIDVQCNEGRNLDTVTQVETLAPTATPSPATTRPTRAPPRCSRPRCS